MNNREGFNNQKNDGSGNARAMPTPADNSQQVGPECPPLIIRHDVSGAGAADKSHVEVGSTDLPHDISDSIARKLHRKNQELFLSSQRDIQVKQHFDNEQPMSEVHLGVLNTRVRGRATLNFHASEKEDDSPARPAVSPQIVWYFSGGACVNTFQLRVENKTWQMDFENLRLPVFSPLLQQGVILASHQSAHEMLCEYLSLVKREEAGRIVLVSGLAGLGKSRLIQHYLYQQNKVPVEERHAMVAWLSGQTMDIFETQWKALADQFRAIDSTLRGMDDSAAIKKWFEEQQSNWLLVIDDWQSLDIEKVLRQLPSKGGHAVITTRHPVHYFDHREMQLQNRSLLDLKLRPLSIDESKQLIEAHFGAHWKVLGHKEETEALHTLVSTIGGFSQGLVQAATSIRKKAISFSRYVMQLIHSPTLQWQLLSDTVLDTFKTTETMAYQWGISKQLLIQRLYDIFPDVALSLHDEILTAWLAQLALFMPFSFYKKEEEQFPPVSRVPSSEFLKQQWREIITAKFPILRERVDIEQLWTVYQTNLSDYLPIQFSSQEERPVFISSVAHHLALKEFPLSSVGSSDINLATTGLKEALKKAKREEEKHEKDEEKEEEDKNVGILVSYTVSFGENARVGHLRSDLLVLGSPDELRAWKLPTENVDFIPRPYATNDLAKKLAIVDSSDQATRQIVLTTAVSGMGGVGKTELARHYVHHSRNNENEVFNRNYPGGRFWFDASSVSRLSLEFRQLGFALQLIEPKHTDGQVKEQVHGWLQRHPGWLVVLDNADDYQAVADWVPAKGGTVLVTTREHSPGQLPDEQIVRVNVLVETEAVQWLCQLSRKDPSTLSADEQSAASELVKQLGYLPLAIVQVAAYLRIHQEMPIADYLKKFISDRVGCLNNDTLAESKQETETKEHDSDALSRKIVAKTWNISLEAIRAIADEKRRSTMAQPLLTICAYLAPAPIPIAPLEVWLGQQLSDQTVDKIHLGYWLDEYLSELLRYSLVQRDPYGNTVSLHRLVQEVVRDKDKITPEAIFSERLNPLTKILYPLFPQEINNRAEVTLQYQLIPHLEQLLEHFTLNTTCLTEEMLPEETCVQLRTVLGKAYQRQGNLPKANTYFEDALESDMRTYGPDHPTVAICRNNMGSALQAQGDLKGAIAHYKAVLESDVRTYGSDHPTVAKFRNNLGLALEAQGDLTGAIAHLTAALESDVRTYGSDHPEVAKLRSNLGVTLRDQGDLKGAIAHLMAALESNVRTYGPDHPNVATRHSNLGLALKAQGDLTGAIAHYTAALESDVRTYGPDHPNVAICRNNMGSTLQAQGDLKGAIEHFQAALESNVRTYGPDHLSVAICRDNLGGALQDQGDLKGAIQHFQAALESDVRTYGPDHPSVAIRHNNLGGVLQAQGDLKGAIEHFQAALESDVRTYGPDHLSVAICRSNFGGALQAQGDLKGAIEHFQAALESDVRTYGPDHLSVAIRRSNLGGALQAQGDLKGAIEHFQAALESDVRTYGPDHLNVAICRSDLGGVLQAQGDLKGAIEHFQAALESDVRTYGPDHPSVAIRRNNLGLALKDQGDLKGAIEHFQAALESNVRTYGPDHPNVAIRHNNLGGALQEQGDMKEAAEMFQAALESDLRTYGFDHFTVARDRGNLGAILRDQGNLNNALSHLEAALQINVRTYGPEHFSVAKDRGNLGLILQAQGDLQGAIVHFKAAFQINLRIYGSDHSKVIKDRHRLELALKENKKRDASENVGHKNLQIPSISSNVFSYWKKYKTPLGVAAVAVGMWAVYMLERKSR